METVFVWPERLPRFAAVLALFAIAGCSEKTDGGAVCPAVCPAHPLTTLEVTLPADSTLEPTVTVAGFPTRGTEAVMLVASRGDTLQTRAVIRFDSLPITYQRSATISTQDTIESIDSVGLRLTFDTLQAVGFPLTINVYDVDTIADDDNDDAVLARFRPDLLVGTVTLDPAADTTANDSVTIPIDSTYVVEKIKSRGRVRFGIEVVGSSGSAQLAIWSLAASGTQLPLLRYDPAATTETARLSFIPKSGTPAENSLVAYDLSDYLIVETALPDPPAQTFALGGVPGRRALLRFKLPANIVDSSSVVRAQLLLWQIPAPSVHEDDSLRVGGFLTAARATIVDPAKIALLAQSFPLATFVTTPATSGERVLDLGSLIRSFAGQNEDDVPRIVVLAADPEQGGRQVWFYGADAPAAGVRPRLRITYIPRGEVGLP